MTNLLGISKSEAMKQIVDIRHPRPQIKWNCCLLILIFNTLIYYKLSINHNYNYKVRSIIKLNVWKVSSTSNHSQRKVPLPPTLWTTNVQAVLWWVCEEEEQYQYDRWELCLYQVHYLEICQTKTINAYNFMLNVVVSGGIQRDSSTERMLGSFWFI